MKGSYPFVEEGDEAVALGLARGHVLDHPRVPKKHKRDPAQPGRGRLSSASPLLCSLHQHHTQKQKKAPCLHTARLKEQNQIEKHANQRASLTNGCVFTAGSRSRHCHRLGKAQSVVEAAVPNHFEELCWLSGTMQIFLKLLLICLPTHSTCSFQVLSRNE